LTEPKSYRFGRFVVDRRSASLRCDGAVLALRPKTFDVLVYLVQHPGRLVPKAELIDKVWPNVNVTENSLVQCIKEIRQALGDDRQTTIESNPTLARPDRRGSPKEDHVRLPVNHRGQPSLTTRMLYGHSRDWQLRNSVKELASPFTP